MPAAHNVRVHASLRAGRAVLRPPWQDVVLAVTLTLVAMALAARVGFASGSSSGSLRLDLPTPKPLGSTNPIKQLTGGQPDGPGWVAVVVLGLLVTAPLAWRRRAPMAVVVAQFTGVFVLGDINWPGLAAILVAAYSLAAYGRWPVASLGVLIALAGLVALSFTDTWPNLPGWSAPFVLLVPIGLFGTTIRAARARADASAQRAELLEREREAATQVAVAQERARLARELHDVVSHHVAVMTIQAGAAGKVMRARPDLAGDAVAAIEASGREAMGELRHLLGLLAPGSHDLADADGPALWHPQPGLAQLDTLVAAVRAAGQPVTTRITDLDLPRGVDLTAYRVVQEALTNALRYAPGAATEVAVDRDADSLVIEVTDHGTGAGAGAAVLGAGTGLRGLTERLRLYHGTIEASRRADGGFRLRACIPLEPA